MSSNIAAIKRLLNAGWINFKRNPILSAGSTSIMALTLGLFVALLAFNAISESAVTSLKEKVDVTAYFKVEAVEDQISAVRQDLDALPEVTKVEYVSREEALSRFRERHAGEELIEQALKELEENPLRASLNIKAQDPRYYGSIIGFLNGNRFGNLIEKVDFFENERVISRIQSISDGIQRWGGGITVFLALVAILVTFITIRLTIHSQQQEIEIMRLVGASNWQIRGPYLIEGGLYGLFAGLTVLAIAYPVFYFSTPKLEALLSSLNLFGYFVEFAGQTVALVLGSGIFLGIISSFTAVRRYLRI